MDKILVKVTNGKQIFVINVTDIIDDSQKQNLVEIKFKECDIDKYKNHFIYKWYYQNFEFYDLPSWIDECNNLLFEVMVII